MCTNPAVKCDHQGTYMICRYCVCHANFVNFLFVVQKIRIRRCCSSYEFHVDIAMISKLINTRRIASLSSLELHVTSLPVVDLCFQLSQFCPQLRTFKLCGYGSQIQSHSFSDTEILKISLLFANLTEFEVSLRFHSDGMLSLLKALPIGLTLLSLPQIGSQALECLGAKFIHLESLRIGSTGVRAVQSVVVSFAG